MLSLNCIGKTFLSELGNKKEVFNNLNLNINKGEFVTVIGSNGKIKGDWIKKNELTKREKLLAAGY